MATQSWSDGEAGGTPLSAARLNFIETRLDTATDNYAETLDSVATAIVNGSTSTSSSNWTDLGGPVVGPVKIRASQKCLIIISCELSHTIGEPALMGYQATGPTNVAPSLLRCLRHAHSRPHQSSLVTPHLTLQPGTYWFAARYQSPAGGQASFSARRLSVVPL